MGDRDDILAFCLPMAGRGHHVPLVGKEVVTKMCGDEKGGSAMNTLPYGPGPL